MCASARERERVREGDCGPYSMYERMCVTEREREREWKSYVCIFVPI